MNAEWHDPHAPRDRMVDTQIVGRGIRDERVLGAMRRVPREAFVEQKLQRVAYDDGPLPIGNGQTISQPYIVARMLEASELHSADHVLDVGTGSGYAAAVLSRIVDQVYTLERHPALGEAARRRLAKLGYENIEVRIGDGTLGWPEAAPFDAILVGAAGPAAPESLKQQLSLGGRLVLPVGGYRTSQKLRKITRLNDFDFVEEELAQVSFVPLVGKHGWTEDGRPPPAITGRGGVALGRYRG